MVVNDYDFDRRWSQRAQRLVELSNLLNTKAAVVRIRLVAVVKRAVKKDNIEVQRWKRDVPGLTFVWELVAGRRFSYCFYELPLPVLVVPWINLFTEFR